MNNAANSSHLSLVPPPATVRKFCSVEAIKEYITTLMGLERNARFKERDDIRVFPCNIGTSSNVEKKILLTLANLEKQVGFSVRFENGKELCYVVEPFQDGYCLWVVNPGKEAILIT